MEKIIKIQNLLNGGKNLELTIFQDYLNHDEIRELFEEALEDDFYDKGNYIVKIQDVSQVTASGYGTWKTVVEINDYRYVLTHHNEEWFYSQKELYNEQYDATKASEENFNNSAWHCIKDNIVDILKNSYKIYKMEKIKKIQNLLKKI